jgi:hypothetical protein
VGFPRPQEPLGFSLRVDALTHSFRAFSRLFTRLFASDASGSGREFPPDSLNGCCCVMLDLLEKLPPYIAISPVTLACPRCGAAPGRVCEILDGRIFDGKVEVVHVERIKAAAAMDSAAKKAREMSAARRGIQIVKRIGAAPCVAVCTLCGREFKASTSDLRSVGDATKTLQSQFDAHVCENAASS